MKPCEDHLPELVDAAEGVTSPTVEAHLAECEGCRSAYTELRRGLEILRPPPASEPDAWLALRIRNRVQAGRRRRRVLTALFPVAAAAALLLAVVLPRGPDPEPRSAEALAFALEDVLPAAGLPGASELDSDILAGLETGLLGAGLDEEVVDDTSLGWSDGWGLDVEAALADADTEALDLLLAQLPG